MANLLQLQNASKAYGAKVLFNEASFAINEGEHVGVIGPNGAGKTTLFKLLVGEIEMDAGTLVRMKDLRLGYLAQHDNFTEGLKVEDFLQIGTTIPLWELKSMGRKLGLSDAIYERPIQELSGGYRMRCKLLALLGQEPQLMLLDEPTNYLDLETTLVLEEFLQEFKGAFLLISHDREFLKRTTDHVLEVEQGEITKFNGHIEDYFEQKQMLQEQLAARAMSLAEKREQIMDFVNRFGAKATKAKQAQSRLKSLAKMEVIEIKSLPVKAQIKIPAPVHTGKQILQMEQVNLGYRSSESDKVIVKNINFSLMRGDHLAVVGLNGAGKSTFLKSLAGRLEPLSGKISLGYQVSIGYYAQHVGEALHSGSTVFAEMARVAHPSVTQQDVLNMAGSLLFSGDDVEKPIRVLSGGEKSRVALGQILLQKFPFLILDEPTNHLDFQTVEALTEALRNYEGTVVVVSHDRSFVRRVGTKILEVKNGTIDVYPGTYDEYVWSLNHNSGFKPDAAASSPSTTTSPAAKKSDTNVSKPNDRELRKQQEKQIKQLEIKVRDNEKAMQATEAELKALNELLAGDFKGNLQTKLHEMQDLQEKLSSLEEQWITNSEALEKLRS